MQGQLQASCIRAPGRTASLPHRVTSQHARTSCHAIPERPASWGQFACVLGVAGSTMGPLLDGLHSRVELQVYDVLPISWAGLQSSWVVPPLLAAFYVVFGAMNTLADGLVADEATEVAYQRLTPAFVALNTGVLALLLQTSASLYDNGYNYSTTGFILATLAAVNWKVFDGTKQGLALALFIAIAAPGSELLLNSQANLWHYSHPDVFGIVSWVPVCYFFYSPALANLARLAWRLR